MKRQSLIIAAVASALTLASACSDGGTQSPLDTAAVDLAQDTSSCPANAVYDGERVVFSDSKDCTHVNIHPAVMLAATEGTSLRLKMRNVLKEPVTEVVVRGVLCEGELMTPFFDVSFPALDASEPVPYPGTNDADYRVAPLNDAALKSLDIFCRIEKSNWPDMAACD